jgi:hypothetical protein
MNQVCESTDFMFPMLADVYYPIVDQGAYGNVKKQWILDRQFACNFTVKGTASSNEEVKPNVNITKENILIGRTKTDIRISSNKEMQSVTNIVITNIKTTQDQPVYIETSGSRSGHSTIYEIASIEPILGFLNTIEYYRVILKRSENQATDI